MLKGIRAKRLKKLKKKGLREIVPEKLNFLVTEYGFEYSFETFCESNIPMWVYKNKFGRFYYSENSRFGEVSIGAETNDGQKVVLSDLDLCDKYKDILDRFWSNHKEFKYRFKIPDEDRIGMFADMIKREIELTGLLFGLPLF